jgi:type II secretory pathway pseudopilin PulG
MNFPRRIANPKGAALIALVAAILLFSVLAAAIVPMISSSSQQSVAANVAAKAYLLAESGYCFAASRFLHGGPSEQTQNQALEDLDGNYHFDNNGGEFNLRVFSYFYELTTPVNGESQLTAHVPGTYPGPGALPDDPGDEIVLDSALKLRIGNQTYSLASGSAPVGGFDDRVTFNLDRPLAAFPAGTLVYPVADVNLASNTTLTEGGNLAYESGDGRMFPLRNGQIQVNGRTLTYRFNDRSTNQFLDVRAANGQNLLNFDLSTDPEIMLTRYVRLHATGIYGSGGTAIQRRVVYYTPLPLSASSAQQEVYSDRFNSDINWSDTAGTATNTGLVGGDSALKVGATVVGGVDQKGALTTFAPASDAASAINFSAAQRGTRGYLSYDTQIKIGYENDSVLNHGFFPAPPIPAYVGGGLSFRLGSGTDLFSNNGYGLSILRGNSSLADDDNIPDDLVPLPDERAVVLWRQTGNGADRTWLAYKKLTDLLIDEDNETSGSNAFDDGSGSTDLWDLEPVVIGNPSRQRNGSTRNWYFGIESLHTYNWSVAGIPVRNSGTLTSNSIALPADSPQIFLTFWSWHETEPGRLDTHDLKQIIVLGSPNSTYTINSVPAPDIITPAGANGWSQYEINLSAYAGQTIQVRFSFDTVDALNNDFEGWYIDDVQLSAPWSADRIQEATLALSLKEAMVVRFNNGTAQIRRGDRIFGARGTLGTVLSPPLISSGTWGGDPSASGTLLLNRTTVVTTGDPFIAGEALYVMGNTGRADVLAWDSTNDTKANIIQVSLATKEGGGSGGNSDPLDRNTEPYGRIGIDPVLNALKWPPVLDDDRNWTDDDGNWSAGEDYFQLIQWDEINTAAGGLSLHAFTSAGQGLIEHATLQSHHDDLQTPNYPGIYQDPEVGLHSMGDGAENVYFDDFGIRLNVFETDILPIPVQQ